jgi:hypothetical protein
MTALRDSPTNDFQVFIGGTDTGQIILIRPGFEQNHHEFLAQAHSSEIKSIQSFASNMTLITLATG